MRRAGLALSLALASCGENARPAASPARPSGGPPPVLCFVDRTRACGLDFVHEAGFSASKHLPETMGAGAAVADLDGDGALDLYLVQSGPLPFDPERSAAPPNRLYLGDGRGSFRDATATSGDAAHRGYGMGVAVGDADGDGLLDLFVTNFGPDVLLLGEGRASFRDATQGSGIADERWTAGALFFDPDADGDLDLYVTAYVDADLARPIHCGEDRPGWRSYCHPDRYQGLQDRYWRNLGGGRFEDATASAGLADNFGKGLGAIAFDADQDGDVDLYVANDSTENRLWLNRGDGSFEDGTLLSGTGVNGLGLTEAGMGLAAGDVDGDLGFELFVTNFDDESNTLYHNDGEGLFSDVTARAGLEGPSRLPVGFGVVLEDLDGDLALDLAVANGHIIDNIHLYHDGKSWRQRPQLFRGDGTGLFQELREGAGDFGRRAVVGRGLYAGDLDGDGNLDLLLTECGGAARLLRNDAPPTLVARLRGLPPGASVELELESGRRIARVFGPAPSYFGASAPELLVALREERILRLRARWALGPWIDFPIEEPLGPGIYLLERAPSPRLARAAR